MANPESETIILLNRQDIEEGFFSVSTTHLPDYHRICRRVGRKNFLAEREIRERGSVIGYDLKLPYTYLSPRTFSIRKPRPQPSQKVLNALKRSRAHAKRKT